MKKETGYSGYPVTENGLCHSKLLGLITYRDIEFFDNESSVAEVMTKDPFYAT